MNKDRDLPARTMTYAEYILVHETFPALLKTLDQIAGIATNDNGQAGEFELRARLLDIAAHANMAIQKAEGKIR